MTCSLRILPKKKTVNLAKLSRTRMNSYMHFFNILPLQQKHLISSQVYAIFNILPLEHKHLIYGQIFQNIDEDPQKMLLGEDGQRKFFY